MSEMENNQLKGQMTKLGKKHTGWQKIKCLSGYTKREKLRMVIAPKGGCQSSSGAKLPQYEKGLFFRRCSTAEAKGRRVGIIGKGNWRGRKNKGKTNR